MPKTGRGNGYGRSVCLPFRVLTSLAFSNAASTDTFMEYDMSIANCGVRAVAVASAFEKFRFKRLEAYAYTTANTSSAVTAGLVSGHFALAYDETNTVDTGTATTLTQLSQYEIVKFGNPYSKLAISVPPRVLKGKNNYVWYNTAATGAPADSLAPGMFILATENLVAVTATTVNMIVVIEGCLEFCIEITPALSFKSAPVKAPEKKAESDDDVSIFECVASEPASMDARGLTPAFVRRMEAVLRSYRAESDLADKQDSALLLKRQ